MTDQQAARDRGLTTEEIAPAGTTDRDDIRADARPQEPQRPVGGGLADETEDAEPRGQLLSGEELQGLIARWRDNLNPRSCHAVCLAHVAPLPHRFDASQHGPGRAMQDDHAVLAEGAQRRQHRDLSHADGPAALVASAYRHGALIPLTAEHRDLLEVLSDC
jgi:hypothetical protein